MPERFARSHRGPTRWTPPSTSCGCRRRGRGSRARRSAAERRPPAERVQRPGRARRRGGRRPAGGRRLPAGAVRVEAIPRAARARRRPPGARADRRARPRRVVAGDAGGVRRAVLPRGVVGIVNDPHEIANVAGVEGVRWWLACGEGLPFDLWTTAPRACRRPRSRRRGPSWARRDRRPAGPPAGGGRGRAHELPGGDRRRRGPAGQGGGRRPRRQDAWRGTRPGSAAATCRPTWPPASAPTTRAPAWPRGSRSWPPGAFVMVREGSVTRDLDALLPLVTPRHGDRVGFVTDDRLPHDLQGEGAVDVLVRRAIAAASIRSTPCAAARGTRPATTGCRAAAPSRPDTSPTCWWSTTSPRSASPAC
jgi:hypothetical protein